MGIGYICNQELGIAVVVWDGLVTLDQWRSHLDRLFDDPSYASLKLQLTDLSLLAIDPSITDQQIQDMVNFIASQRNKISLNRLAVVAGADWARPKLVERLIQALSITTIVFNDMTTGCKWLGVDLAKIEQDIKKIRAGLQPEG